MRSVKADFLFGSALGEGTYGVVWQAVRKQDGNTYAIKELDLRFLQRQVTHSRDECPHAANLAVCSFG